MKGIFILLIFISYFLFSFSIVQQWNLQNSAIDLLDGKDSISVKEFESTGYDMLVKLYRYIGKKSDGSIEYKKYLDVYKTDTNPYTELYKSTVNFESIESFYYLNNKAIICPKGKYHPLTFNAGSYTEINVGNNFEIKGDWELKCYHHYNGYLFVFYLMNKEIQFFRTRTDGSFSWVRMDCHDEIYDFKLQNGNEGREYALAYLVSSGEYLKLLGSKFTIKNDGVFRNDCGGTNQIMKALTNTRGCFDRGNDHFYFLTYSNISDFSCGYYEQSTSIDYLNVGSITINKNEDSPLEFVDKVEIQEIKFIYNYKYAYYVINNLTNGKTYRGIIDTRTGLVVFNTEETILTYVPFNSISMLAITSNHAYQICIIKKNGECIDSYYGCSDTGYKYILDLQGNKCSDNCDTGKILMVRENFCSNSCDESIYILENNKCGLCSYFHPDTPYKIINTASCLSAENIPEGAEIYNAKL